MTDKVLITDLLLRTIIGINDEERVNRQDVVINIEMHADLRAAGASDDIANTVNYRTIAKAVIALVENSAFYLVEHGRGQNRAAFPCIYRTTWRRCRSLGAPPGSREPGPEVRRPAETAWDKIEWRPASAIRRRGRPH